MHTLKAYEEVVDFIASGTSPDTVAVFKPSDAVSKRVRDLLYFEKTRGLTHEETSEQNHRT
ncbi:MAG: hypothetical protein D3906_09490, partial [Candidatus Electrothrix sp. AUS1_2]|nr:hypothetical protein [Candidatus Electrothrix sp. AUS1_2]